MARLNLTFSIGQIVFLITDTDQNPRLVVEYTVHPNNSVTYGLACGSDEVTHHYEFEISEEKTVK